MQARRLAAGLIVALLGCNSEPAKAPRREGETIRYRLLLRENPVSPQQASHCYADCQSRNDPKAYVECLSQCPGFETTPGEYCSKAEVPPVAACLTVRTIPATSEPPPGLVVLAVIGEVALVVGAASLCSLSNSQCGGLVPPR